MKAIESYDAIIKENAAKYAIEPNLIRSIINEKNPDAGVAQHASNYNNQNAANVISNYGKRVKSFSNWFGEHYAE